MSGIARRSKTGHNYRRLAAFYPAKLQNRARRTYTRFIHAKRTGRDRQTAGVATNVSPDVTRLDPHSDDDDSAQRELDGTVLPTVCRVHKRFQLRDDNDGRRINPWRFIPSKSHLFSAGRARFLRRCKSAGYF